MREGWDAKDLLKPLWIEYGGRDKLADDAKVSRSTLASANSGKRKLGRDAGEKIAATLGVSLIELGAPEDLADARGRSLLDRQEELQATVAKLVADMRRLTRRVGVLERRLAAEPQAATGRARAGR